MARPCLALTLLLGLWMGIAVAGEAAPAPAIPRVPDTPVDASPWGDRGYAVDALDSHQAVTARPGGPAARFRAGWNERGLRVLVEVRDLTPEVRHPPWMGDSIEIFIARKAVTDKRMQFIFCRARPDDPTPLKMLLDYRLGRDVMNGGVSEPKENVALRVTDYGYAAEVLVPWKELDGMTPAEGETVGLQVEVNDLTPQGLAKLFWFPRWVGGPDQATMGEVRLTEAAPTPPTRWAAMFDIPEGFDTLTMRVAAADAWAGKPVTLLKNGQPVAKADFTPLSGGWAEAVLPCHDALPDGKESIRFTIRLPDDSTATIPLRYQFPRDTWKGGPSHGAVSGHFRVLLEALGDKRPYSAALLAATAGDSLTPVFGPPPVFTASEAFARREDFQPLFDLAGYDFTFTPAADFHANPEASRHAIVRRIVDQHLPVIIGLGNRMTRIVGFEDGGDTLLVANRSGGGEPVPDEVWKRDLKYLVTEGGRREPPPIAEAYRRALARVPEHMNRRSTDTVFFGKAAYERWADFITDPATRERILQRVFPDRRMFLTPIWRIGANGHFLGEFLEEARAHCPDQIARIDAMKKANEALQALMDGLQERGVVFDIQPTLLNNPEAVAEAQAHIRRMGAAYALILDAYLHPERPFVPITDPAHPVVDQDVF